MAKTKINYDWINTPPPEDELITNADGSQFIPIGIVEKKLYRLDTHWGTENFQFNLLVGRSGLMFADGSLQLVITYGGKTRRLVGAATLLIPADVDFEDPEVNANFSGTLKSEATKNSVKPIGLAFGQGLNDRLTINTPQPKASQNGRKKPDAVELPPDGRTQAQYDFALENGNSALVNTLRHVYPTIKYTGTKKVTNAEN